MKYIFLLLLAIPFLGCEECDFSIPKSKRDFLSNYHINDTLYFESQYGDIDTIAIVKIDSIEQCGSIMAVKRKHIAIEVKHLPTNKWTGGTESHSNGKQKILNQNLIVIEKQFHKNDNYWIGINYRDFSGEIHDSLMVKDDYLIDYGIKQYWIIENKLANWEKYKHDSSLIVNLIWTKKYGLTEYKKRNGNILRVKKLNFTK